MDETGRFYWEKKKLFRIVRLIIKSGIIMNRPALYSRNWIYSFLRRIFFLRCSPLILKQELEPEIFTSIVSTLSIGPTHKTTNERRHEKNSSSGGCSVLGSERCWICW